MSASLCGLLDGGDRRVARLLGGREALLGRRELLLQLSAQLLAGGERGLGVLARELGCLGAVAERRQALLEVLAHGGELLGQRCALVAGALLGRVGALRGAFGARVGCLGALGVGGGGAGGGLGELAGSLRVGDRAVALALGVLARGVGLPALLLGELRLRRGCVALGVGVGGAAVGRGSGVG